jgi:recombination protein RecR
MLPTPINNLIQSISSLPGIGKKGATKIILDYLISSREVQDSILKSFIDVRQQVTKCPECHYLSEQHKLCGICSDHSRIDNQIMVVQSAFDIVPIENNGAYHGRYHVLEKLISPLDKQMVTDTTIYDLETRIEKFLRENPAEKLELIYFVKHSFAALTTFSYIDDYIKKSKNANRLNFSQLATGLPTNFNIQQIDQDSFKIAYENRK